MPQAPAPYFQQQQQQQQQQPQHALPPPHQPSQSLFASSALSLSQSSGVLGGSVASAPLPPAFSDQLLHMRLELQRRDSALADARAQLVDLGKFREHCAALRVQTAVLQEQFRARETELLGLVGASFADCLTR